MGRPELRFAGRRKGERESVNEDDPRIVAIRRKAAVAVRKFAPLSGLEFGFDRGSVEWVDGFIERIRLQDGMMPVPEQFVSLFGSYLGEAIVQATNGNWTEADEGALVVRFANGDWCSPFSNVRKQFEQGHEGGESIASFYEASVNLVATGRLRVIT